MAIKPTVEDIHAFLAGRMALIVHFSGLPKGTGYQISFPDDLREAIANAGIYRLSCSLIKPGDLYDTDPTRSNATGTIGIIIDLAAANSIIAVDPSDAGSGVDPITHRKIFSDRDISVADCVKSLDGRTTYNEWGIQDYVVRGLFVFFPVQVNVLRKLNEMPGGEGLPDEAGTTWYPVDLTLKDIAGYFPGIPIYTFFRNWLVELHPVDGSKLPVSHAAIYR
jgi:hypothetical protein